MLIELWERLRGYDKWVAAEAKIESSQLNKIPVADRSGNVVDYNYSAGDVITWTDPTGEKHYADFDVDDKSPLYQYIGGESVPIRYDPADPDRFYYRDLLKSRVRKAFRTTIGLLVIGAIVSARIWLHWLGGR
jgi:hypothetical protein